MITDIRLQLLLFDQPKVIQFEEDQGEVASLKLIKLWLWVARNKRFDGNLHGLTDEAIESIIRWKGKPGSFVGALIRYRLLAGEVGSRYFVDWAEWQPHVSNYPALCERMRKTAYDGHAKSRLGKVAPRRPAAAHAFPARPEPLPVPEPIYAFDDAPTVVNLPTQKEPKPAPEPVDLPPRPAAIEPPKAPSPAPADYPADAPSHDMLVAQCDDPGALACDFYERLRPDDWKPATSTQRLSQNVLRATSTRHGAPDDMTCGEIWQAMVALRRDQISKWLWPDLRTLRWLIDERRNGVNLREARDGALAWFDRSHNDNWIESQFADLEKAG